MSSPEFCCTMMKYNVENSFDEQGEIKYDDVDVIINFWKKKSTYGIPIHDGGTSMIVIHYCPWCGVKLPDPDNEGRMIDVDL